MSGMHVAVLGAGGTIAPAIVRDLAESGEVDRLLLIDLDEERAEAVARDHGLGKARVAPGDARTGIAGRLGDADVLVNAASYRVNLDAMRACLEAGCHYLDLGGLYWMTDRQLELDADFRRAGLLALLGMGSSPGKTNLMALRAVRELGGETAERVSVVAAGRDLDPPDGLSLPYSLETLLDELKLPPVAIADGRPRELAPLSPGGTVRLPEPVGETDTIYTLHSELRTFPHTLGCREASFRLSLEPGLLARLRGLAAAPYREVAATARDAARPSAQTVAFHLVEAEADGRVVRVIARTDPAEAWGLGGGVVSTGAPAAAAVRLLARGRLTATGTLPPESCVEPDELLPELERRGCRFTVEHREAVAT